VDYPIKTLGQLRPILQGFRKAAGLTQAGMASHLGVTQQTYAQLEANPAAVSVDRLFRVLRVLQVDLTLVPRAANAVENDDADADEENTPRPAPILQAARKTTAPRSTAKESAATVPAPVRSTKRKTSSPSNQKAPPAAPARTRSPATTQASSARAAKAKAKPHTTSKKREDW
jgi:HTH-type transcriptional regulator / antitoxin HipB